MKTVLLMNPPGRRLYIRDYFCSKVSQADNLLHPIDLVILSGILQGDRRIELMDCIAGRIPVEQALARARELEPDAIICLAGSVSLEEDIAFLARLREACPRAKLVGIGDAFLEDGERYLREIPALDALLLDFASTGIVRYLDGDVSGAADMIVRDGDAIRTNPRSKERTFSPPPPRHDLFQAFHYRHSLIHADRFVTTIIDYGCPFPCTFCIMNCLGFKIRPVDNIMEELRAVKALGIREIFFHTQTFGSNKAQATELCRRMIDERLGFGWVCFSRVDVATPEFLDLMRQAGCHGIIFGVESGSERILKAHRKQYSHEQILRAIDYCDRVGIETTGTFILGLPEDDHETIAETLRLLKRIKLDYAGISVAVPRVGTDLRRSAIEQGLVSDECRIMDQSGTSIVMPTMHLSREDLMRYRKTAIRTFYFRPSYIWKRLRKLRIAEVWKMVRNAAGLVRSTWFDSGYPDESAS